MAVLGRLSTTQSLANNKQGFKSFFIFYWWAGKVTPVTPAYMAGVTSKPIINQRGNTGNTGNTIKQTDKPFFNRGNVWQHWQRGFNLFSRKKIFFERSQYSGNGKTAFN